MRMSWTEPTKEVENVIFLRLSVAGRSLCIFTLVQRVLDAGSSEWVANRVLATSSVFRPILFIATPTAAPRIKLYEYDCVLSCGRVDRAAHRGGRRLGSPCRVGCMFPRFSRCRAT